MSSNRAPEINVTPLIDVLLVLLIIFMVVAPTRPSQFEAQVPSKSTDAPPSNTLDPIVVSVGADREISVDGSETSLDDLESQLRDELLEHANRAVILRAPTSVRYHEVVAVLDRIKGAGAAPIGLQVDLLDA